MGDPPAFQSILRRGPAFAMDDNFNELFTVIASKDGDAKTDLLKGPANAVERALRLIAAGWTVKISGNAGAGRREWLPPEFTDLMNHFGNAR